MRSSRRASQASKWRPLADLPRPPPPPLPERSRSLLAAGRALVSGRQRADRGAQGSSRILWLGRALRGGWEGRRMSESSQ